MTATGTGATPLDLDPASSPDLDGHVRLTLLDDDGVGCSAYFPAEGLSELVERIGRQRTGGKRLCDKAGTDAKWARLRDAAFEAARVPERREGAARAALWCAMNGPTGKQVRRGLAGVLGELGRAVIIMQRDRRTRGVATMVAEGFAELPRALVRMAGQLPAGVALQVGGDKPRQEH